MSEPNQGCLRELLITVVLILNIFGFSPQTWGGVRVTPMPLPSVETPVETGLLELVDLSALSSDAAAALVGSQIATTGLPDASLPAFETIIDNDDIASAEARPSQSGDWQVNVFFTSEGSARIAAHTEANIGRALAIVLDGRVLSAPTVQARIEGMAVISGNFTESEARELAAQLSARP